LKLKDLKDLSNKYGATMDLQEVGVAVRDARERQNLSQTEAGKPLRMSRTTISGLENGTINEIGIRKVIALCDHLGLELVVRPRETRALDWNAQLAENARIRLDAHNAQRPHAGHEHDLDDNDSAGQADVTANESPRPA
jgi:HTH-type transcriptional regulator / antitoxin HipB